MRRNHGDQIRPSLIFVDLEDWPYVGEGLHIEHSFLPERKDKTAPDATSNAGPAERTRTVGSATDGIQT